MKEQHVLRFVLVVRLSWCVIDVRTQLRVKVTVPVRNLVSAVVGGSSSS
jgi:hypothetical protein